MSETIQSLISIQHTSIHTHVPQNPSYKIQQLSQFFLVRRFFPVLAGIATDALLRGPSLRKLFQCRQPRRRIVPVRGLPPEMAHQPQEVTHDGRSRTRRTPASSHAACTRAARVKTDKALVHGYTDTCPFPLSATRVTTSGVGRRRRPSAVAKF